MSVTVTVAQFSSHDQTFTGLSEKTAVLFIGVIT